MYTKAAADYFVTARMKRFPDPSVQRLSCFDRTTLGKRSHDVDNHNVVASVLIGATALRLSGQS